LFSCQRRQIAASPSSLPPVRKPVTSSRSTEARTISSFQLSENAPKRLPKTSLNLVVAKRADGRRRNTLVDVDLVLLLAQALLEHRQPLARRARGLNRRCAERGR
jgi:hypothetical protein